ncbi:hypothetical protein [Halorhodospira halochloris]|uniref:hypothetical protein n=1 Tax=Halorhodospira halochloris TaxID=1052 RepID=UPI001EE917EB|nr:hypothetical protein [Halorhodospira halochloris]MCG5548199.1 hypothetical protein [Halorhodospira halochloris]
MNKIQQRVLVGTACAAAALFAGSASASNFFFNYGHTFLYTAFDSDVEDGDISANTFDFGLNMNEQFRLGVYYEHFTGDQDSAQIQGFLAEYDLAGGGDFVTSMGLMLGKIDGVGQDSVADIYGKFSLRASENSHTFAKIAYRGSPNANEGWGDGNPGGVFEGGDEIDDLNGMYVNLGFGFSF